MSVPDDEVIKRKLIIEGESGNDDKRITLLLKNYLRWTTSDDVSDEGYETYQALIASVYQCENAMEQSSLVISMNTEQQKQYAQLYKEIENSIEMAKARIEKCKEDLRAAKIIRKNRREYDSLAKVISEHPERKETLEKYNKLKNTLEKLQKINQDYDEKIALRKTQFHLYLVAIRGLQRILEDDPVPLSFEDANLLVQGKSQNDEKHTPMEIN